MGLIGVSQNGMFLVGGSPLFQSGRVINASYRLFAKKVILLGIYMGNGAQPCLSLVHGGNHLLVHRPVLLMLGQRRNAWRV